MSEDVQAIEEAEFKDLPKDDQAYKVSEDDPSFVELKAKVSALKQIINTHDLVMQGSFPGHFNVRIKESIEFLEGLHRQILKDAKNHEYAHLIPDLVQSKAKGE